ncbi:protein ABHD15-like [Gigantopelta aegis]|uniref:protein ABHD15-like n=1 Tax=Gigantopelta aegis TaxID=1735272 RepID=UPI001B887660|nr:protein ABHD15-like [Gigantopelta aegis]
MFLTIIIVIFILVIIWILDKTCWQTPALFYKRTPFTDYIVEKVQRLSAPYKATFWLSHNRHFHTITATRLRKHISKIQISRQYLELQDGGVVALDWSKPDTLDDCRPILIILSGIEGNIKLTSFVCAKAAELGYRTVVFNRRGHGGSYLTTPKLQSFGDPSDFKHVVEFVRKIYPQSNLLGLSFSAGGGILMSYLGEEGERAQLTAAVLISPGFSPLEQSTCFHWLYETLIVRSLKRIVHQHSHVISPHIDVNSVLKAKSITEFDKNVYCKFYNHDNVEEYWSHNDPMRNHSKMTIPVLFLCSLDDPVLSAEFIPYDVISEHSDWIMATVDRGGHCAFREGINAEPWAECVALEYLDAVLKYEIK